MALADAESEEGWYAVGMSVSLASVREQVVWGLQPKLRQSTNSDSRAVSKDWIRAGLGVASGFQFASVSPSTAASKPTAAPDASALGDRDA